MQKSSLTLSAPELQTEYHITVDPPKDVGARPLVIVLDGDDQFKPALKAAREAEREGLFPPLALVGVGYGGGYRSPLNRRARDYTPTQPKDEPMESGGAEAFHAFLVDQLVPFVVERCGIQPMSVGLTGHSLSSLFGLHAWFRPRPFFDHFLISSPSIWWDDRAILRAISGPAAVTTGHPTKAFISVGAADTPSMTGDLTLLEAALEKQAPQQWRYTVKRFPDRDHYTSLPVAFLEGFQWLYSTRP